MDFIQEKSIFAIQKQLKDIILDGGDIYDILKIIAGNIGTNTALVDLGMQKTYYHSKSKSFTDSIINIKAVIKDDTYFTYEFKYQTDFCGYLVMDCCEDDLTESNKIIILMSEIPLLLLLQKRHDDFFAEKKHRDKFIQDIIFQRITTIDKVEKFANIHGWDFSNMTLITVLNILIAGSENKNRNCIHEIELNCNGVIISEYPESIYTIIGNKIIYLLNGVKDEAYLKNILDNLINIIEENYSEKLLIGVGSGKSGILMAHQSYNEALIALKIGKKISDQKIFLYNNLGTYKLLASVHNSVLAEDFLQSYLAPLIKYDEENCQILLYTLNTLVKNDWDIKKVSEEQYIHYNTVKYRIKKISDILNLDLTISENKINIALALKLYHLNN
ncbi:MAG: PucR family transcriptional regulator [Halanaerobiaceae bacterium]